MLDITTLENCLSPGYLFFIFPIPFDQNIRPLNKEDLETADNFKILILEDKDAKASYTIYRGTYLHKILPSEFLDCSFKIPQFTQGQPLSEEFKENLKELMINSINKIKNLLV